MAKSIFSNFRSLEKFGEDITKIVEIPEEFTLTNVAFNKPYLMLMFVNLRDYPYSFRVVIIHYLTKQIITDYSDVIDGDYYYSVANWVDFDISNEFDFVFGKYLYKYDMATKTYTKIQIFPDVAYNVKWVGKKALVVGYYEYGTLYFAVYDKENDNVNQTTITGYGIYSYPIYDKTVNKYYISTDYNNIFEIDLETLETQTLTLPTYCFGFLVLQNPLRFVYVSSDGKVHLFDTTNNTDTIIKDLAEYYDGFFSVGFAKADQENLRIFVSSMDKFYQNYQVLFVYDYATNQVERIGIFDYIANITFQKDKNKLFITDFGFYITHNVFVSLGSVKSLGFINADEIISTFKNFVEVL